MILVKQVLPSRKADGLFSTENGEPWSELHVWVFFIAMAIGWTLL